MSYHITVGYQPNSSKFPFALNTEADQIPLTRSELESLKFEIDCALMDSDPNFTETQIGNPAPVSPVFI